MAFWFYYKSKKQSFTQNIRILLFAFRSLTITLIVLLILNPKIIFTYQKKLKPLIVLAIDNSKSIRYLNDSIDLLNAYNTLNQEVEKLSNNFDVKTITFGENVCDTCLPKFIETQTNISSVFKYIDINMQVNPPEALVLVSDGLINNGGNPMNAPTSESMTTFSIAMCDTSSVDDLWIAEVVHNPVTFAKNKFPVEIDVRRNRTEKNDHTIEIFENETVLGTYNFSFQTGEIRTKSKIFLSASEKGIHQYKIRLKPVKTEKNTENNESLIAIEVLESETKVLMLYQSPTPDVAVIKQAFQNVLSFQLDIYQIEKFQGKIDDYKVIIFSQIPNVNGQKHKLLEESLNKKKSIWFLMGSKTDINALNQYNLGWSFSQTIKQNNYVYPVVNQNFDYFIFPSLFNNIIDKVPPIFTPFGNWTVMNEKDIALSQRIGSTITTNPLLITTVKENQRFAVFTGEGLWRWRIYFGRVYGNSSPVYDFIQQVVNFLSLSLDVSPFRVTINPIWTKTSNIYAESFTYNINYQPINNQKVDLVIQDKNGNETLYRMPSFDNHYRAYIGSLPVGSYVAKGIYETDSSTYTDSKTFIVADIDIEKLAAVPDTVFLKNISGNNHENLFYRDEIGGLSSHINSKIKTKTKTVENTRVVDFISLTIILILLALSTTLEWLIRKYNGQM